MTAVYAGSFDPITIGHIDIINRAYRLFGDVVVLVVVNSEKKYHFSRARRVEAIRACFSDTKAIKVEEWNGLTADYVKNIGSAVLVRGARNGTDYDGELNLFDIYCTLGASETLILPAKSELRYISSTFVRELIRYDKDISPYVPKAAIEALKPEL